MPVKRDTPFFHTLSGVSISQTTLALKAIQRENATAPSTRLLMKAHLGPTLRH